MKPFFSLNPAIGGQRTKYGAIPGPWGGRTGIHGTYSPSTPCPNVGLQICSQNRHARHGNRGNTKVSGHNGPTSCNLVGCPIGRAGGYFGGSSTTGRRAVGKRAASLQAQGAGRRHHQGSQAALILPQAGREAQGQAGPGAQASEKEEPQRPRLPFRSRLMTGCLRLQPRIDRLTPQGQDSKDTLVDMVAGVPCGRIALTIPIPAQTRARQAISWRPIRGSWAVRDYGATCIPACTRLKTRDS
jgi:hypothetical protein